VNVSLKKSSTEIVAQARKAGFKVGSYVCNTPEDFAVAREFNVDYFTSDFPSTILPLMRDL
jgi:glycerophosphoryl diester phosphodiesterase